MVELAYRERTVNAPVWILPGHPDDAVTVHLGYGRSRAGQLGTNTGFDAYSIRPSSSPNFGGGLQVTRTGDTFDIYSTQDHHAMELEGLGSMSRDRNLIRVSDIETFKDDPHVIQEMWEEPDPERDLYPDDHAYDGPNAWGMVIDLNKCNGCNTCTIACQSENNISVVGKEEVANGREMHWIRIDRYYRGDLDAPETYHQPVPCMQCENAPCELVCPVGATVHSKEGLKRHGLQPLRRNAVLFQQLSVQGPAVQLLPVCRFRNTEPAAGTQPGRNGAQPRSHGEMYLLRPAHQRGED